MCAKHREEVTVSRQIRVNLGCFVSLSLVDNHLVELVVRFQSSTRTRLIHEHLLEVDLEPHYFLHL